MKSDIHTSLSIKSNSCLFAACLFFWIKHGVLWQTHETLIADQSRMADFFFLFAADRAVQFTLFLFCNLFVNYLKYIYTVYISECS